MVVLRFPFSAYTQCCGYQQIATQINLLSTSHCNDNDTLSLRQQTDSNGSFTTVSIGVWNLFPIKGHSVFIISFKEHTKSLNTYHIKVSNAMTGAACLSRGIYPGLGQLVLSETKCFQEFENPMLTTGKQTSVHVPSEWGRILFFHMVCRAPAERGTCT